ncbi:hypothetical protein D9M73_218520 [compost metagenome]
MKRGRSLTERNPAAGAPSPLTRYSGTHQPSVAPFTGSPTAKTSPAASALRHNSLRPAHCSAITWISFCRSAFSMVSVLPGSTSVLQPYPFSSSTRSTSVENMPLSQFNPASTTVPG